MNQRRYEEKKSLLKRIRKEWGYRLSYEVDLFYSKKPFPPNPSRLDHGERLLAYMASQEKLSHFIRTSILFRHNNDRF